MNRIIIIIGISAISLGLTASGAVGQAGSGDAITPERLLEQLMATVSPPTTLKLDENGIPEGWTLVGDMLMPETGPGQAGGFVANLWTNGTVHYVFDSNVAGDDRDLMRAAMDEWEDAVPTLAFEQWIGQANWVRIRDSNDDIVPLNNSAVGMTGGEQIINIKNWDKHYTLIHELGHTLGYHHEQSRPDRDESVQINWDYIPIEQWGNFVIFPDALAFGPYDFDSVMHYGQCAASTCGVAGCNDNPDLCRTITVLPPNEDQQDDIGQRTHLSTLDIVTMSFMYPEPGWAFVDESSWAGDEDGSFPAPWQTFLAGYANEPAGTVLHVAPGGYLGVGTFDKAMTIKAPVGAVELGLN